MTCYLHTGSVTQIQRNYCTPVRHSDEHLRIENTKATRRTGAYFLQKKESVNTLFGTKSCANENRSHINLFSELTLRYTPMLTSHAFNQLHGFY